LTTRTISASIAHTASSAASPSLIPARHDFSQLAALLDAGSAANGVWADTAYRSKANLRLLDRRRLVA
jgi:hypothetical protein